MEEKTAHAAKAFLIISVVLIAICAALIAAGVYLYLSQPESAGEGIGGMTALFAFEFFKIAGVLYITAAIAAASAPALVLAALAVQKSRGKLRGASYAAACVSLIFFFAGAAVFIYFLMRCL